MTRIPELGDTLSVSKLDAALQERRSSSKTGRQHGQRSQRKTELSCPGAEGAVNTSSQNRGRTSESGDGPDGNEGRDSQAKHNSESSHIHLEEFGKRNSKHKERKLGEDTAERIKDDLRISFTAARLSPRSRRNKEKHHTEDITKDEMKEESLQPRLVPQNERLLTDFISAVDSVDDIGEKSDVVKKENVAVKPSITIRPRSESRLSQSRGERTNATRPSSGAEHNQSWPHVPREGLLAKITYESGMADNENEESDSQIRQIWRKELGLDARPPRRQFGPKQYITGLATGYPGQKPFHTQQQTITTTVVPTTKLSVKEIRKRRKVLPPIDSKTKTKGDDPPPAQNRVKDINALAVDLCKGATIEIGNSEAEAVYRTYREARKNAFYVDLPSNVGSARSTYPRPCHAPPNSDDEDGYGSVQEIWNDSSYCRIVRISSPDNDGETVITHTVDASKVLDFGGRVVRKTQIDVFLPSDTPGDEPQSGNGGDDGMTDEYQKIQDRHCHNNENEKECDTRERPQIVETEKRIPTIKRYDTSEEDDEDDSGDVGSEESSDDDDDDEGDNNY